MSKLHKITQEAMRNMGIPQPGYPAPIAEAYRLLGELGNMSLHELCAAVFEAMVKLEINRHISYITAEDGITTPFIAGLIGKVTVEWVDASEADPNLYKTS